MTLKSKSNETLYFHTKIAEPYVYPCSLEKQSDPKQTCLPGINVDFLKKGLLPILGLQSLVILNQPFPTNQTDAAFRLKIGYCIEEPHRVLYSQPITMGKQVLVAKRFKGKESRSLLERLHVRLSIASWSVWTATIVAFTLYAISNLLIPPNRRKPGYTLCLQHLGLLYSVLELFLCASLSSHFTTEAVAHKNIPTFTSWRDILEKFKSGSALFTFSEPEFERWKAKFKQKRDRERYGDWLRHTRVGKNVFIASSGDERFHKAASDHRHFLSVADTTFQQAGSFACGLTSFPAPYSINAPVCLKTPKTTGGRQLMIQLHRILYSKSASVADALDNIETYYRNFNPRRRFCRVEKGLTIGTSGSLKEVCVEPLFLLSCGFVLAALLVFVEHLMPRLLVWLLILCDQPHPMEISVI